TTRDQKQEQAQEQKQETTKKQEEKKEQEVRYERRFNVKKVPITEGDRILFYIEKTPCYGFCPVYRAWIYPEGKVLFEGKRNVEFEGLGVGELSEEKLKYIYEMLKQVPWEKLQDQYVSNVTDIPATLVAYPLDEYYKAVYIYFVGQPPEELAILQKTIKEIEQILLKEVKYEPTDQGKFNPPQFKVERADIPRKGDK
ncbi:MAG: hypothetical protein GXO48_04950, partial [Chlorobi bacterium]|nr:hypothetical protein [Chlorobiota bacterium]